MNNLTIVMYHYVRPIAGTRYPGIKGLELSSFKRQLDYIESRFNVVTTEQVIRACAYDEPLPDKSCWLTFDDGYRDHFAFVLPELLKRGLHGAFFPPRIAIEEDTILDVNAIHYILSCTRDLDKLLYDVEAECKRYGILDHELQKYLSIYAIANRFDNAKTVYVKRLLQRVLPEAVRMEISSQLFKEYVGVSQEEFSRELYMDISEVKELVASGMYVGSHGSRHYWLDSISYEMQESDISESLKFLERVGAKTQDWIMCYPYGAFNTNTISILEKYGAAVGVTTEAKTADISTMNPLMLPRFDTNDFPS